MGGYRYLRLFKPLPVKLGFRFVYKKPRRSKMSMYITACILCRGVAVLGSQVRHRQINPTARDSATDERTLPKLQIGLRYYRERYAARPRARQVAT